MNIEQPYDDLLHTAIEKKQWGSIESITNESSEEVFSTLNDSLWWPEVQQLIVRSVEEKELRGDIFANGFNGKIFLIEHPLNHKKYLAVKSRLKSGTSANLKMMNEYGFLVSAHKKLNLEESNPVKVPKPYWLLNDHEGSLLLVMDYIDGVTVFSYKTSKVLPIMYTFIANHCHGSDSASEHFKNLWNEEEYQWLKTDKEIKEKFGKLINYLYIYASESSLYRDYFSFYSHAHNRAGILYESSMAKIYDKMKSNGLIDPKSWLSPEIIESIKDHLASAITTLHKNDIYHNDLNYRNIMLGEDGNIYIIDFDKADIHYSKNIEQARKDSTKYTSSHKGIYLQWDYRCLLFFDAISQQEI